VSEGSTTCDLETQLNMPLSRIILPLVLSGLSQFVWLAKQAPSAQAEAADSSLYDIPRTTRGLPKELILYQYEVCPFCCKVKAFLDYHKVRRSVW
jgi:hypothetical protein